jgi:hypothetical protein
MSPILMTMNPIYNFQIYFFNIPFNNNLTLCLGLPHVLFPLRFLTDILFVFILAHKCAA